MVCERNSNLMRRITTLLIISCLLTLGLCVNTASALPGSGTQEDPWRIESLADFDEFAADPNYWSGFTRLETDVNLAGRTYTTAVIAPDFYNSNYGFDGTAFSGVFDGNDYKITNLTINGGTSNHYLGLFGYIVDGEVKNLRLEGGSTRGDVRVGGLVGHNRGSISNCYSTNSVYGYYHIGGLVGENEDRTIANCYSTGDIIGNGRVGGLVGVNWAGPISNFHSTGDVNGIEFLGGLVGLNGGSVSNCYSTNNVSGTNYFVGGLVGQNGGSVSNCYSTGDISGTAWDVGGLVGINGSGTPGGRPTPAYIYNSFSTGSVNGVSKVGGLVGYNYCGGIDRSFWDVQTSGEPNMCGDQWYEATGCDPNCGKTTAEMKTLSAFTDASWDFVDIWLINEGATYPVLRQEIRSDLNGDRGVNLLDFAIFADHWLEGTGD